MIAYLKGKLEAKSNEYIIIEVNGIGYKVFMSGSSINELERGTDVKVFTYMKVREDDVSLFGFLNNEELVTFELLISVGGIGAKSAISILNNITPSKFALAVITNDVNSLKKLPGIGAKTAQRIILELQDKLKSEEKLTVEGAKEQIELEINNSETVKEAIQALQILGYNKKEIDKVMEKIEDSNLSVEELIRKGLSLLSR